jgi:hypothetical protein
MYFGFDFLWHEYMPLKITFEELEKMDVQEIHELLKYSSKA